MQRPLFSVIIPTLNEEQFLPHLLESLSVQINTNFEVIVVDGKSKDKTMDAAARYRGKIPNMTIIESQRGLPLQRNNGARHAAGDWFLFSDADNILLPYTIERMASYVSAAKPALFTCWCRPDSEKPNDALIALLANVIIEGSILFKRQFTPGPLTVVKRTAFDFVGGYTQELRWGEDYDFGKKLHDHGIHLNIIRETLYIWSMRRFRNEGTLKVLRQFAQTAFFILLTKKGLTRMPGYDMGGHVYGMKKKHATLSVLKMYEKKLKRIIVDLFE